MAQCLLSAALPTPVYTLCVANPGRTSFLRSLPLVLFPKVYNEQIHDLLEPKGPLTIREDPDKGVVVPGLSFHQVFAGPQVWPPRHWPSGVPSNAVWESPGYHGGLGVVAAEMVVE